MTQPLTRPASTDKAVRLACGLLRANGLIVLDEDWRWQSDRLGIVAQDGRTLAFVAVVNRSSPGFAPLKRLVTGQARIRLRAGAGQWLRHARSNGPVESLRFDLVTAVVEADGSFDLRLAKGVA